MAQTEAFEPTTLYNEIVLKGLTAETLAEEADVHVATVYRALKGLNVRPRSRQRINNVLSAHPVLNVPAGLVHAQLAEVEKAS